MNVQINHIGQGDEIFWALYNLHWYECKPDVRKTINMMIRQARRPMNIDYHGRTKMNLSNFMQVVSPIFSSVATHSIKFCDLCQSFLYKLSICCFLS